MAKKYTPFKSNGYGKTTTVKSGTPKSKTHLEVIKQTLQKKGK